MREHVDEYLEQCRREVSLSTYRNVRATLGRFADWWDSTRKVPKSLRGSDVQGYLWGPHACDKRCRGRQHRGPGVRESLGPDSFNIARGQLRRYLDWAFRRGVVRGDVVDGMGKRARTRKVRRLRLDAELLRALYEGAEDPYHRWVCALAVYTAGRNGELLTLRVEDLDLDAGEILWERHKVADDGDTLPIVAELEAEARRWLSHYRRELGRPLLPSFYLVPRRQVMGRSGRIELRPTQRRARGLSYIVKEHLARVLECNVDELRGEGVHPARRSMARLLYERLRRDRHADPIAVVQALLGHANRSMTERYIGVESGRQERDRVLRGRAMLGED